MRPYLLRTFLFILAILFSTGSSLSPAWGQVISTAAGTGAPGYTGDGGAATSARLNSNEGVGVDAQGNFYVVDSGNDVVRKVNIGTGVITTVAGSGSFGYSGDGGPATSAKLGDPSSIVVDAQGNLYICDSLNNVVRKVTAATGVITTIAGTGACGYSGNGGPATSARMCNPDGITLDASGNIYVAEISESVVVKINAATGIISAVAGTGGGGYNGDGIAATAAELSAPEGLAFDPQ